MNPVYPLGSLCRPRGPVNPGGGSPLQVEQFEAGGGRVVPAGAR
jgi:hypothetical protein